MMASEPTLDAAEALPPPSEPPRQERNPNASVEPPPRIMCNVCIPQKCTHIHNCLVTHFPPQRPRKRFCEVCTPNDCEDGRRQNCLRAVSAVTSKPSHRIDSPPTIPPGSKPQPPHPITDKQRQSVVRFINPHRYHIMGLETVCPSCGVIEPYRHGRFSQFLCWDATCAHEHPLRLLTPAKCFVVCFDPWCRDNIPPGTATTIRLNKGAKAKPPYIPKHAESPDETFTHKLLYHHRIDNFPPVAPERRALLESLSIQELVALDHEDPKSDRVYKRELDELRGHLDRPEADRKDLLPW